MTSTLSAPKWGLPLSPEITRIRCAVQAELAGAVSSERLAALNFRRLQSLLKTGAIAQAQVDEARVNLEVAAAKRVSAQSNLKIAQEQLGYTRLVAPSDGVVTSVNLNPGQTVSAGQGS